LISGDKHTRQLHIVKMTLFTCDNLLNGSDSRSLIETEKSLGIDIATLRRKFPFDGRQFPYIEEGKFSNRDIADILWDVIFQTLEGFDE
jgi:hypothetical protein